MTATWPADKVERRSVESLIPYARNARTHSEAQVAQIAASIKEWGWTTPVLVDEDSGIIAGHGRVMAAQKLALKEVPVMVATGWTEAQKKAYVLADNQLALNAGWDTELMRIEIDDLADLGFDVAVAGFSEEDLADLLFDSDAEADFPELSDEDRSPFQQMTFTIHDDQAEQVRHAIEKAKKLGPFVDELNENGNGNALARICEVFNGLS